MYDVESTLAKYKEEIASSIKTSRQRRKKMDALTEEAQSAHKTGRYDVSYEKFCFILAIIEMDPHRSGPDEMSAMITSNIASALHFLGEVSPHLARARTLATCTCQPGGPFAAQYLL